MPKHERPKYERPVWAFVSNKGASLPKLVPLGELAAVLAQPGAQLVAVEDAELTGLDEAGNPYRRTPRIRIEEE